MAIRSLLVLPAIVALALSGCSDEEERIDGSGYSYAVPDGWEDASDEASDIDLDLQSVLVDSVVIGERRDDFTTNVNVVREEGLPPGVTARQYAEASLANIRNPAASGFPPEAVEELEDIDSESLDSLPGTELGGSDAASWEYTDGGSAGGAETQVRQVAAVRDGAAYIVTLTALPDAFEDGTAGLEDVVASWEWD
jgi:hypothetical protein